jgi:hypothetical protein
MSAGLDFDDLVDKISRITPPDGEMVGEALGTQLDAKPGVGHMVYYEAALPLRYFESADLRINTKTKLGILVLRARASAPLREDQIDFTRYGKPKNVNVSPDIPPEGATASTYAVSNAEVTFQFTTKSRVLRVLSFSWPAASGAS